MFGRELRKARKSARLTQDQLARRVEELTGEPISRQGVGKWELGEAVPERSKWPALETALKKPAGWVIRILEEADKMNPYGNIIKAARVQRGMDQDDLAEVFGVSQQMVSLWEKSGSVPRKHWSKLAEVLGVNLSTVGNNSGNTNTQGAAVSHSVRTTIGQQERQAFHADMTEDEYFLWMAYKRIPPEKRQEVLSECQRRLMRVIGQFAGE